MVNIRRRQIKAYVLLESLIAMALLAVISVVALTEISVSRRQIARQNQQIEVLNVGLMAYDSQQTTLTENGVTVNLTKKDKKIILESLGQEVLRLEILQESP